MYLKPNKITEIGIFSFKYQIFQYFKFKFLQKKMWLTYFLDFMVPILTYESCIKFSNFQCTI